MPSPKTFEEHLEYLRETVKLKFWFLREWLEEHPEENFSGVIRKRIDILRKTDLYTPEIPEASEYFKTPQWLCLEKKAEEVYEKAKGLPGPDYENALLSVFSENIDAGAENSFKNFAPGKNCKCGSLTYHSPSEDSPSVIAAHIANALCPASIFDDRLYLPHCLNELMDKSEAEFGVSILHCGSWLNSHPRWTELFPQEWQDNMSGPDKNIQWHFGFWGQFITARGTFHWKNAEKFRKSGKMPFAFRTSDCSFKNLREHLKGYVKNV